MLEKNKRSKMDWNGSRKMSRSNQNVSEIKKGPEWKFNPVLKSNIL
jgi:hypothetical protein